jgi:hypothetical protein
MRLSPTRRRRIDAVGWDVALQVEEGGDLGQGVLGVGDQVLVVDHQQGVEEGRVLLEAPMGGLGDGIAVADPQDLGVGGMSTWTCSSSWAGWRWSAATLAATAATGSGWASRRPSTAG